MYGADEAMEIREKALALLQQQANSTPSSSATFDQFKIEYTKAAQNRPSVMDIIYDGKHVLRVEVDHRETVYPTIFERGDWEEYLLKLKA